MKIITISGKALHGKDSAAEYISDILTINGYSNLIIHYADLLKFVLKEYYHWNGIKDATGRSLLQYVGTDLVRARNENFWIEELDRILTYIFPNHQYAIIADARFPNEIEYWIERDMLETAIKVYRPKVEEELELTAQNHESETALDDYPFPYTVEANDLNELHDEIEMVMKEVLKP